MYSIENQIQIAATPARALVALTTSDGLRGWWTANTDCDVARREATFRFERQADTMAATFRIDRADERGVAMTCIREQNNADWLGTKLEFGLAAVDGGTRVALVHSGYRAKNEVYDSCTKGWAYFLASLKSYLETGTGTPHVRPGCAGATAA